jgi:hypothetical protein
VKWLLLALLASCELRVAVGVGSSSADLAAPEFGTEAEEPEATRSSGGLEPGFYARQCQWDACEEPYARKPEPATNPVRE